MKLLALRQKWQSLRLYELLFCLSFKSYHGLFYLIFFCVTYDAMSTFITLIQEFRFLTIVFLSALFDSNILAPSFINSKNSNFPPLLCLLLLGFGQFSCLASKKVRNKVSGSFGVVVYGLYAISSSAESMVLRFIKKQNAVYFKEMCFILHFSI